MLAPERNAPRLLGYIPSYNTTLAARKKSRAEYARKIAEAGTSLQASDAHRPLRGTERLPIDRDTPDPFSGSSTEMPRAPFTPTNLEEDMTPGDAIQTTTTVGTRTETTALTRKRQRPEVGGGGLGDGSRTSDIQERPAGASTPSDQDSTENPMWNPPMSHSGFQVRRGHSVQDGPRVAYALLTGTLLPRDTQELPKDLESSLALACQLHIQVPTQDPSVVLSLPSPLFLADFSAPCCRSGSSVQA